MRQARPVILATTALDAANFSSCLPTSRGSHLPGLKLGTTLLRRSRSSRQPRVHVLASTLQSIAVGSAIFAAMRMTRLQISDGDRHRERRQSRSPVNNLRAAIFLAAPQSAPRPSHPTAEGSPLFSTVLPSSAQDQAIGLSGLFSSFDLSGWSRAFG